MLAGNRSTIALVLAIAAVSWQVALIWYPGVAGAYQTETVFACGGAPYQSSGEMQGFETSGTATKDGCTASAAVGQEALALEQDGINSENDGATAGWFAYPPVGLGIVRAQATVVQTQTLGGAYDARFQWDGTTSGVSPIANNVNPLGPVSFDTGPNLWAADFGFALACVQGGGCPRQGGLAPSVFVSDIQLTVGESPGYEPAFASGSGLWSQPGWVRGNDWSLGFAASSPANAGICTESATLNGLGLPGAVDVSASRNEGAWHQCWAPPFSAEPINTTTFGQGSMPLTLNATDAVGVSNSVTKTVSIDNSHPVVSFSGPTTASSSAGTQYVTATGGGSPSGIAQLQCSVDGGPMTSYKGATARVPVSGLGSHVVSCLAENNAVDAAGVHGSSTTPATFTMDIGSPTAGSISFGNIIHGLKCKKVTEREKIPAKWVMVRRRGKLVREHRAAPTKRVKVMKCRERFVKRKVIEVVKVKRHGKVVIVKRTKIEKVPVPPQTVNSSTKRVSYGRGATVSGILATTSGTALAGRTVQILTAPNNQLGQWSQVTTATTAPDGTWSATLPPGPSRLAEASYAGDTTTLPSTSNAVMMVVPARIKITITPHQLPWNGVLTLHGHLAGGYVPPDGVAMRVLIGLPHLPHPYLAQSFRTNAAGAFELKFKAFGGGHGVTRYPVWLATTSNESDYAYGKNSSRHIEITFGRHTPKKTAKGRTIRSTRSADTGSGSGDRSAGDGQGALVLAPTAAGSTAPRLRLADARPATPTVAERPNAGHRRGVRTRPGVSRRRGVLQPWWRCRAGVAGHSSGVAGRLRGQRGRQPGSCVLRALLRRSWRARTVTTLRAAAPTTSPTSIPGRSRCCGSGAMGRPRSSICARCLGASSGTSSLTAVPAAGRP